MQSVDQSVIQDPGKGEAFAGMRAPGPTAAVQTYRNEHLLNLSPVQVVQKLYDVAIQGCKRQNYPLAQRALTELIVSLNFEQQEMATGLYRLYDYCKRQIREGKSDEAVVILEDLRTTWSQAFNI
jgi:flagellar protein FliS